MFWLVLAGATAAVWLGIVVHQQSGRRSARTTFALLGLGSTVTGAALPFVLGEREANPLGVTITASPAVFEVATLLAYAGGALAGIALLTSRGGQQLPRPVVLSWYALNGTVVVSSLLLPIPQTALPVIAMTLVVHALASAYLQDPRAVTRSLRGLARVVVIGSVAAGVLAPEWAVIPDTARQLGIDRLSGFTPHPNSLTMVASIALVLELLEPRGKWRPASIALIVVAILWAQSTAGFAILLCFAIAAPYLRHRSARVPIVFVVGGVALMAAIAVDVWSRIVTSVGEERVGSVSGRSDIWAYAVTSWQAYPWLGQGAYFLSEEDRLTHLPPDMQQASNAHNQVLQVLGEAGLVGLVALAVLLVAVFQVARRARALDHGARLVLLFVVVVNAVVEVPIRAYGLSILPALLALPFLFAPPPRPLRGDDHAVGDQTAGARLVA